VVLIRATGIHSMLEELNAEKGWEVPMHVDAVSGIHI
jgi:hypothetical protein